MYITRTLGYIAFFSFLLILATLLYVNNRAVAHVSFANNYRQLPYSHKLFKHISFEVYIPDIDAPGPSGVTLAEETNINLIYSEHFAFWLNQGKNLTGSFYINQVNIFGLTSWNSLIPMHWNTITFDMYTHGNVLRVNDKKVSSVKNNRFNAWPVGAVKLNNKENYHKFQIRNLFIGKRFINYKD